MNKKVMWLMVGLVAAVLPAVAVADVMLTAYVTGSETTVGDAFYVQPGSNYANANALAGFAWTPHVNSESEILGTVTIGYMSNETITEINVLDVNFSSGVSTGSYFNITVNVTSVFPTGSYIYISQSPQSLATLPSAISLSTFQSVTQKFMVSSTSTIYIGFTVGSGAGGGTFQLSMSLVEA